VARLRSLALPSWRQALGGAALAVLVALPVAAQIDLAQARRELDATRAAGRDASADARTQRSLVSAKEQTLTGAKADEAAAATEVELARTLLATTGVEEHALVKTLDDTRRQRDDVEAQRTMAAALLHQQELDLPTAKECVLEANRGLMRHVAAPRCTVTPYAAAVVK
jgi:hypothetical protein